MIIINNNKQCLEIAVKMDFEEKEKFFNHKSSIESTIAIFQIKRQFSYGYICLVYIERNICF